MSPARIVFRLRCLGLLLPFLVFAGFWVAAGGTLRGQTGVGSQSIGTGSGLTPGATTVAPGTVQGQVINAATGAAVARALVRMNNRAVLTDAEGKFRFDRNTDSNANVMVTKPGFWATTEMQDVGSLSLQGAQLAAAAGAAAVSGGAADGDGDRSGWDAAAGSFGERGEEFLRYQWAQVADRGTDADGFAWELPAAGAGRRLQAGDAVYPDGPADRPSCFASYSSGW